MKYNLVALVSKFEKDVKTIDKVLNQGKEPDDIVKNYYDGDCVEQDIIEDLTKYTNRQNQIAGIKEELDKIYQKYEEMSVALEQVKAHFFGEPEENWEPDGRWEE